jgi:hypothetical protein
MYGAPKRSLVGKQKRLLQTYQRKMERRIPQVVWRDTATNAEVGQTINVKNIRAVAHPQGKMGRKCGKNVTAQAVSVWDTRIGKKRTGLPKTRWADTFKRVVAGQ